MFSSSHRIDSSQSDSNDETRNGEKNKSATPLSDPLEGVNGCPSVECQQGKKETKAQTLKDSLMEMLKNWYKEVGIAIILTISLLTALNNG